MKSITLRSPKEIWAFLTKECNEDRYPAIVNLTHIVKLVILFWVSATLSNTSNGYDNAYIISNQIFVFALFDLIIGTALIASDICTMSDNYLVAFLIGLSPMVALIIGTLLVIAIGILSVFFKER